MIKKAFKTLWAFLSVISVVSGLLPEYITSLPIKTRSALILLGFFALLIWGLIFKVFNLILRKIRYLRLRRRLIKIGISVDDQNLGSQIVDYCNKEIQSIKLSNRIRFETFRFKDSKLSKIHKKVAESNLDLVVWISESKSQKGKIPINFVYKNTSDNLIAKIVHSQLSSLISIEKMFNFNKSNFVADIHLEKKNIAIFSLYIVAVCTTILRGNKDGIYIFEKLNKTIGDNSEILRNEVSEKLGELYLISGRDLMVNKKYSQSLIAYEKGYKLIPKNRDLLAGLAVAKFFNKDFAGAESITEALLANYTNFSVAHLDAAFFRVRNKKYKKALKHYLLFARCNDDNLITLDAIGFFDQRIDENPKEYGYLFARGFLKRLINKDPNQTRVGETNYTEDLEAFVERARNIVEYEDMIEVAIKYLNKK